MAHWIRIEVGSVFSFPAGGGRWRGIGEGDSLEKRGGKGVGSFYPWTRLKG